MRLQLVQQRLGGAAAVEAAPVINAAMGVGGFDAVEMAKNAMTVR